MKPRTPPRRPGLLAGLLLTVGLVALVSAAIAIATPSSFTSATYTSIAGTNLFGPHVNADSTTFTWGESCEEEFEEFDVDEGEVLWHFVLVQTTDDADLKLRAWFEHAGLTSPDIDSYKSSGDVRHWNVITPGDDILKAASTDATGRQLNLSHVCRNIPDQREHLTVTKTAETSFEREHFWSIEKKVETENGHVHDGLPKVWLYTDGRGDETATWTIDVTYEGYEDSGHNVSGTITILNDGDLDAEITSIEDVLGGTEIDVDCGEDFELPYTLPVGESIECTYDEDVGSKIEGENVATVKTTANEDGYVGTADIVWGDPTTETNKTVNVMDLSDLFGEVELGSVTAPNDATFIYEKEFAWEDYGEAGCGDYRYDNTATIVETEQSASATLLVNVQCFVTDSAWARGDGSLEARCFTADGFSNWGWTNQVAKGTRYTFPLFAGAAKCGVPPGYHVGTVTFAVGGDGKLAPVTWTPDPGVLLTDRAVYSGCAKYPKVAGKDTTAPGKYKDNGCGSSPLWAILHAKAKYPDPTFGPTP